MKHTKKYLLVLGLLLLLPTGALADDLVKDDFTQVSCGEFHNLALRNNGDLWAWGLNDNGQVGNGGESDSESRDTHLPCQAKPVLVLDKVTGMSAGYTHSLAVRTDGSLWGWGSNVYGELGFDNGDDEVLAPKKIMDDVQDAAAGAFFSLILKIDGSLLACGLNDFGQLGSVNEGNASEPILIMGQVAAIAVGNYHALAVQEDGSLWAWGWNDFGQVGNGGESDSKREETGNAYQSLPVQIYENGVKRVTAGASHSLAVMEDGVLWCWGLNDEGFLMESDDEILTAPQELLDEIKLACAGNRRTFVIKDGGSLWGWGCNAFQAMDYNYTTDYTSATPKKILDNVVDVGSGSRHTMAVQGDGTLWGWGDNSYGQLAQSPGPLGLPVRIRVEYPAWPEEPVEEEEEPEPTQAEEEEPEQETPPTKTDRGSPLPFIIGCSVIALGGLAAFIVWRKKRKGAVGEWRK